MVSRMQNMAHHIFVRVEKFRNFHGRLYFFKLNLIKLTLQNKRAAIEPITSMKLRSKHLVQTVERRTHNGGSEEPVISTPYRLITLHAASLTRIIYQRANEYRAYQCVASRAIYLFSFVCLLGLGETGFSLFQRQAA